MMPRHHRAVTGWTDTLPYAPPGGPTREPGATLRVVVADDERPARSLLVALLRGAPDIEVVGEAADGAEAVTLIERVRPDLVFLDLQMPELDGLGVVRALERARTRDGQPRAMLPLVAFVTAYDAYAVRAFDVHAVDYLLKPVDARRLRRTITRAHERLDWADQREDAGERLLAAAAALADPAPADVDGGERVLATSAQDRGQASDTATAERAVPVRRSPPLERIPVRRRDDVLLLPVSHLLAVVADGELLHLHTVAGERHTISYRLKDLELRLPAGAFVRLSRGALVRLDAVRTVAPMPGGTYVVTLAGGMQLPVSRIRSRYVRDRLLRL